VTLEEARQAAIDRLLAAERDHRWRHLLLAAGLCFGTLVLLAYTLTDPLDWARGDWFRPGSWPHETFGFAGAVLAFRLLLSAIAGVCLLWARRIWRQIADLPKHRAKFAAELDRLETVRSRRERLQSSALAGPARPGGDWQNPIH
jgi:hypothetical protein